MSHNPETRKQVTSLGELTASPSEGFTEMEDLEDGTDDNLSFVSNPNLGPFVGTASLTAPPYDISENSHNMELWVSMDVTHIVHKISAQSY
jgi:hypothetical protein